jgi:uncharacterized protein YndB with AHSA1/START domain
MTEATLVYEDEIKAPPERVFTALTTGEQTRLYWFDRRVESDWTVGSPVNFYDGDSDRLTDTGEVLAYEPAHRLSYTFKYLDGDGNASDGGFTRVTFDLAATAGGTRLRLVHDQLASPDDVEGWRQGWTPILTGLRSFAEK